MKQCATLMTWSSLRWLKCTDRDIWRCLADAMCALRDAGVQMGVRWIRSHPEGRLAHTAWCRDDVSNHMADRWAAKAQTLPDSSKPYTSPQSWDVAYEGTRITGPLRRSVKAILVDQHLRRGLLRAGRVTENCDVDWLLVRRCMDNAKKEGLGQAVWWAKVLGNVLATETVLTKRGHGVGSDAASAATCKLCGEGAESNWHMIAECTACVAVVDCRRKMVESMHTVLDKCLSRQAPDVAAALRNMWTVDDMGRLRCWEAMGLLGDGYTEALGNEEHGDPAVRDHVELMRDTRDVMLLQTGVDCAAVGCVSKGWRRLIKMETELSAGNTLRLLTELQTAMRKGIRQVWLQRNKARQDWVRANSKSLWQRRDAALDKLMSKYKQRGLKAPAGMAQHVKNLRGKHLRKWIARQEQQQRSITEFFNREAVSRERKVAVAHRRARTAAVHSRSSQKRFTQSSLVGCPPPQGAIGRNTLAFSQHLPAHALQNGPGNPQAAGVRRARNANPTNHTLTDHPLQRKLQLRISCTGGAMALAEPILRAGSKRRAHAPADGKRKSKLQRSSSFQPTLLRTRKRAACTLTSSSAASGMKRKQEHTQRRHGASGQKRKAATGIMQTHRNPAHCTGSESNSAGHRASGSVHVDGQNAAGTLQTSTMRPPD